MARKSKVLSKSKAPKKDFTKKKNKVGKKREEKANEMKTDFKVKKVQMPAQNALEEKGEEVTHRKLGLGELLAHLQHHSSKVRRDALKGLLELCRDHPAVLNVNLSQILDSISLAASDGSADVRAALRSLQAFILDAMPSEALLAFGGTLALQVRTAISHVSGEVREDGLKLLELYLSRLGSKEVLSQGEAGRLVGTLCQLHSHVDLVLPCLLQLLSSHTATLAAEDVPMEAAQVSLQDVLEGKLRVTSVSAENEAADNEIWEFCLRAWMQAGDLPQSKSSGDRAAKPGWMRLRVAAVLEQSLLEVLAGSSASRPTAAQVATLSGIVRRQEWPIHVDSSSALRPLADSINLRMARCLALLACGAAPVDAAPKHLQRLAFAALSAVDALLLSCTALVAQHHRKLGGGAAAAAAAAQALEALPKASEAHEVKPFTTVGCLCHGLRTLDLLWCISVDTEYFSASDVQRLTEVTAAVASGTGTSSGEFLPTTAAILAVPLTASLLGLPIDRHSMPSALHRSAPEPRARRTPRCLAEAIEEVKPGTLANWVTSWPKMLWYLGSSHPKLSFFLMATILKLGKAAESGSLHEQLLSLLLPLLVPFIAGMPGDENPPPLAKLHGQEGLQEMGAAMLFHFPRLRVSLIQLLSRALCRWSFGENCRELILEAMLREQPGESDPKDELLVARLRAALEVLQMSPDESADDAGAENFTKPPSAKLMNIIAAWVVEQLGARYPGSHDRPVPGLSLDQRRRLALQHVAWPLCRQMLEVKDAVMRRRAFCFFYLCARRLSGCSDDVTDDASIRMDDVFLREVFAALVVEDVFQSSPVFHSLLGAENRWQGHDARAAACLFVEAWMSCAHPHRSMAYELLLRLCAQQLARAGASLGREELAWLLVEAVTYRNTHGLSTESWGLHPLGFLTPLPKEQLQQQLPELPTLSGTAREHVLALLPLM